MPTHVGSRGVPAASLWYVFIKLYLPIGWHDIVTPLTPNQVATDHREGILRDTPSGRPVRSRGRGLETNRTHHQADPTRTPTSQPLRTHPQADRYAQEAETSRLTRHTFGPTTRGLVYSPCSI